MATIYAVIDSTGLVVELADELNIVFYNLELHEKVDITSHIDTTWRIGDTITVNPDGTFASIAHRYDNSEEIQTQLDRLKPVKWKANLRLLIAKMKDGTATVDEIKRGLKICMFLLASMYDEDDEPE